MSLLAWVAAGLLAGLVAWVLVPGRRAAGCFLAAAFGLGGALLGGAVATWFGFGGIGGALDPRSLTVSLLGAVLALLAWRLFVGRSKEPRQAHQYRQPPR